MIGYDYLLPHRNIMIEPFTRGVPMLDKALTGLFYPLLVKFFGAALKLSPQSRRRSPRRGRSSMRPTSALPMEDLTCWATGLR